MAMSPAAEIEVSVDPVAGVVAVAAVVVAVAHAIKASAIQVTRALKEITTATRNRAINRAKASNRVRATGRRAISMARPNIPQAARRASPVNHESHANRVSHASLVNPVSHATFSSPMSHNRRANRISRNRSIASRCNMLSRPVARRQRISSPLRRQTVAAAGNRIDRT